MKTYRPPTSNEAVLRRGDFIAPVLHEIRKVIVGQDYLVNRLLRRTNDSIGIIVTLP